MKVYEVELWFGNLNQACIKLDISSSNMTKWKSQGYIPWKQQFKLAIITEGALMPDEEDPYLVCNPRAPRVRRRKSA
jgi:hypothetical protein